MLLDLYFHHTWTPERVFGGGVTAWQRHLWRRIEDEPNADQIIQVIKSVAERPLVATQEQTARQVRTTLENMGIAYKEAYQEIYLELLAEMLQEQEDAQIVAVMAALL